jgi:hypothetical protein
MKRSIRFPLLLLIGAGLVVLLAVQAPAEEIPNVDLAIVANTANIKHGHVGEYVTFTIVATNNGPDPAPTLDVYFIVALQGLENVVAICDLGISPDGIDCEYHGIVTGQTLTTTVVATLASTGHKTASLTACVQSETIINDPNVGNDCGTATLKIVGQR